MWGDDAEARRALLGLWALPGIGEAALAEITRVHPDLSQLLDVAPLQWVSSVPLTEAQRAPLLALDAPLRAFTRWVIERANLAAMKICFQGDPAYPRGLAHVPGAPPMLFYWGRGDRPNAPRRLAMVGSRRYEPDYFDAVHALAYGLAQHLIVVSGGAQGVDQDCHDAAIEARGETWAFMGSGLDQLDRSQAQLAPRIVGSGGTVFSQFPPGVRADRSTFVRRNPFIAGASDAVFLLRGAAGSGALHTVDHAQAQGRPIFAMPGQIDHATSFIPNALIGGRVARAALSAQGVLADLGITATVSPPAQAHAPAVDLATLSPNAQHAYEALTRDPVDFDALLPIAAPLDSGRLASALVELELAGLVRQTSGRRYERS